MTMKPYKLPLKKVGLYTVLDAEGREVTRLSNIGEADAIVGAANAHDALVAVLRCAKALRAREMELANEAKWMYVDDLNRGFLAGELDRALAAPELAGLLKEISDAK